MYNELGNFDDVLLLLAKIAIEHQLHDISAETIQHLSSNDSIEKYHLQCQLLQQYETMQPQLASELLQSILTSSHCQKDIHLKWLDYVVTERIQASWEIIESIVCQLETIKLSRTELVFLHQNAIKLATKHQTYEFAILHFQYLIKQVRSSELKNTTCFKDIYTCVQQMDDGKVFAFVNSVHDSLKTIRSADVSHTQFRLYLALRAFSIGSKQIAVEDIYPEIKWRKLKTPAELAIAIDQVFASQNALSDLELNHFLIKLLCWLRPLDAIHYEILNPLWQAIKIPSARLKSLYQANEIPSTPGTSASSIKSPETDESSETGSLHAESQEAPADNSPNDFNEIPFEEAEPSDSSDDLATQQFRENQKIPQQVWDIMKKIEAYGHKHNLNAKVFLIGTAATAPLISININALTQQDASIAELRKAYSNIEALLQFEGRDYDITTNLKPSEVSIALAESRLISTPMNELYKLQIGDKDLDIYCGDNLSNLKDNAYKRILAHCAIFVDSEGHVYDPSGQGLDSLKQQKVVLLNPEGLQTKPHFLLKALNFSVRAYFSFDQEFINTISSLQFDRKLFDEKMYFNLLKELRALFFQNPFELVKKLAQTLPNRSLHAFFNNNQIAQKLIHYLQQNQTSALNQLFSLQIINHFIYLDSPVLHSGVQHILNHVCIKNSLKLPRYFSAKAISDAATYRTNTILGMLFYVAYRQNLKTATTLAKEDAFHFAMIYSVFNHLQNFPKPLLGVQAAFGEFYDGSKEVRQQSTPDSSEPKIGYNHS